MSGPWRPAHAAYRLSLRRFRGWILLLVPALAIAVAMAGPAHAQSEAESLFATIQWEPGPTTQKIGKVGEVHVPEGFVFTGPEGTRTLQTINQNPTSGDELGIIMPTDSLSWFVLFSFDESGYVRDDEKDNLDAEKLLEAIRKGNEHANEIRRKNGWTELEISGWFERPAYDPVTHNLTWAVLARSEGEEVINRSTRILGRRGVLRVNLVGSPEEVRAARADVDEILAGYSYRQGEKYAEFTAGDKVAEYGLAALVTGGAAVAVAKSGLLAKFGKAIFFGVAALFMAIRGWVVSLFKRTPGSGGPEANA